MKVWIVWFVLVSLVGQWRTREVRKTEELTSMANTIHGWQSTNGNGKDPASWTTGEPPGVAAVGILTMTGNALNNETVTLDAKVYTFQTSLTDVDGHVQIGADADESIGNLVAAITLGPGAGTKYAASTTLHPTVTAAEGAGDTMDVTAKDEGTAGNSIATTETLTNGSFGGGTLSGGTQWDTTDDAYFDPALSDTPWSSGLDFPAAIIAGNLRVADIFSGGIGADGNPLKLIFNDLVVYKGLGDFYWVQKVGGSGSLVVDTRAGRVFFGDASSGAQYLNVLSMKNGEAFVAGNVTLYETFVSGWSSRLIIDDEGVQLTHHVHVRDGFFYCRPTIKADKVLEVSGGLVELRRQPTTDAHLKITGGRVVYIPPTPTTSQPHVYVDGGILDLRKAGVPLTFGRMLIGTRGAVLGGQIETWGSTYIDLTKEWP